MIKAYMKSHFVYQNVFIVCRVVLGDVFGIEGYQLLNCLLQLRTFLDFNLLDFSETIIGGKCLLGFFVLGDNFGNLLDQVGLDLSWRVLNYKNSIPK
jgi:hypothetical protein